MCQTAREHTAWQKSDDYNPANSNPYELNLYERCYHCHPCRKDMDEIIGDHPAAANDGNNTHTTAASDKNKTKKMTKQEKKEFAVLEVLTMTVSTPFFDSAKALAIKEGCTPEKINWWLGLKDSKAMAPRTEKASDHYTDGVTDQPEELTVVSYADYLCLVEDDTTRLLNASREGRVSICSWDENDNGSVTDENDHGSVTITKLPQFDCIQTAYFRCDFLHRLMPREYITLIHNSIAGYFLLSSYGLKKDWCAGYNANTCAYDFQFSGVHIDFTVKQLFRVVYGISNGKPSLDYRDKIPSFEDLAKIIGEDRIRELATYCEVNNICDLEEFLDENKGEHALLPGLWLSWKALVTSPHLYNVFDKMLQEWEEAARKNDASEQEGEGELEADDTGVEPTTNNSNKKRKRKIKKFTNNYKKFKKESTDQEGMISYEEMVRMSKDYLQKDKGIMDMLSGVLHGALDDWETRGNNYATLNLIHAIEFFLISRDRFDAYERDEAFEVKVMTKENMENAGVEAFISPPNMQRKVRMPIAAVFDQSIMIKAGKNERPITDMTAVVYLDKQLKSCKAEVHRIILDH